MPRPPRSPPDAPAPAATGRPSPGDRKRLALLEATYVLIAEKGLEGLRTRDIVARAGVNISMLHYYFGTKEELLLAVVGHIQERAWSRDSAPNERLHAHLRAAWQSFQDDPHLAVVLQELALRALRDPPTRLAFDAIFRGWNLRVEHILRHEQAHDLRRRDLDPRRAAPIVTAYIMGAMTQLGIDAAAFDFTAAAAELDRSLGASEP